jgi:two-component system sensor histidine kinase AlgZ
MNLKGFVPYLIIHLVFLIGFSKIIKSILPAKSILFIATLSAISVFITHSIISKSLNNFINNWDQSIVKVFLAFGILFFFLMYFDWRERNVHPSQVLARLSFLQSKMRPHFLFNTLNSILSLIKSDPLLAKKMILNLSEILRASLRDNSENYSHSMLDEINLCKKYLEIEKMRLGERLSVIWEIDEKTNNAMIPKLSLQPLIENSILHGIQNLENGGEVFIKVSKNLVNRIFVEVRNQKAKKTKIDKNEESHNNISIKNLEDRLNIFFDYDVCFKINDLDFFFYVQMNFPKKEMKQIGYENNMLNQ